MIEWTIKVPSKEECSMDGYPCYNCDLRSITNCIIFRDHMLKEHETFTSAKETSKVTYEDIKESVEELRKQKEKIERLQKEFIEEEVKKNPLFMGYYIDTEKKLLSLYGLPIYSNPSVDKNTFIFQKSDGEIIKVGLPKATTPLSPSALHYSSAPSGKIPMPSKEPTELEFHVAAGKYLDKKIKDVFNLSKEEVVKIGLDEYTAGSITKELLDFVSEKPLTFHVNRKKDGEWRESGDEGIIYNLDGKGKKISLKKIIEKYKRSLSKKVVLRENFC